jgi:tight adherence protein C
MSVVPIVLGALAVVIAIGLIAVGIANRNQADPLADKLREYAGQTELTTNLEQIELSIPFAQRVIMPMLQRIADFTLRFTPAQMLESTQHMLDLAGNPKNMTPPVVVGLRVVLAVTVGPLALFLFGSDQPAIMKLLIVAGGSVAGFFLPVLYLRAIVDRRKQEVIKFLPDALDLMTICVEAGLGFDAAMTKVYEKWDNVLGLAFGRVVREIQLGASRRQALRSMSDRLDVPDVSAFTAAIIQADQLGVSIATVLSVQAEQMRIKRRQRAEEKAQQAPVKIMIPLAIFILPSIWIVTLGPAMVQMYGMVASGTFSF